MLVDQYLNYNVGWVIFLGNLNGFDSLVIVEFFVDCLNIGNVDILEYFNVVLICFEQVCIFEVGFWIIFFEKFYLDVIYYYSFYNDFIGFNIGVDVIFDNIFG